MRALAPVDLPPHDPLGVLHRKTSLPPLDEDDGRDDRHHHDDQPEDDEERQLAALDELERLDDGVRKLGHDPGEDDERDPVPDPPLRDLLAQPHDEGGAGREGDHRHQAETPARLLDEGPLVEPLEPDGDPERLNEADADRSEPGIRDDLLPSRLPFLRELLQGGDDDRQELKDDRGADVRHDPQREDRHAGERPSREDVKEPHQGAALLGQKFRKLLAVDPRRRDMAPDPVDGEHHHGEKNANPKLGNLDDILEALKHPRLPRRIPPPP